MVKSHYGGIVTVTVALLLLLLLLTSSTNAQNPIPGLLEIPTGFAAMTLCSGKKPSRLLVT